MISGKKYDKVIGKNERGGKMKKKIGITMADSLLQEVEEKAKSKGINRSAMISIAVSDYMKAEDLMDMLRKGKKADDLMEIVRRERGKNE